MREAFYLHTYNDVQALNDPRFQARGSRKYGPFTTYEAAAMYPLTGELSAPWTHFSVDKVFVKDKVRVHFLDNREPGNRGTGHRETGRGEAAGNDDEHRS